MKHCPLISILLPNLNTRPYLEERMDSILNQTYENWELIIADSYSDDGSWEYLKTFVEKDKRITAYQIPKGLYQAWNFCVEKAKGEYIYIATSDDTMTYDCIKKMVETLEKHPECDICDSKVKVIDEKGIEICENDPEYPIKREFFKRFGNTPCVRHAPYDFLEQMNGETIYISITEIMIRKRLFDKTGLFPTEFGHIGDFPWGVMAGLYADVVYLPEKLGTWRVHKGQVSKNIADRENIVKASRMIIDNVNLAFKQFQLARKHKRGILKMLYFRYMLLMWHSPKNILLKLGISLKYFLLYPTELVICPILFFYKRIFRKQIKNITDWRWEKLINSMDLQSFITSNNQQSRITNK
jgi:glycosyltransferase involved in cell wall biosynthesis